MSSRRNGLGAAGTLRRVFVMGHCFNPECNEELLYLRLGSVYQWETGLGRAFHSEFFWLCPVCSSRFKVASDDDGEPLLVPGSSKRPSVRNDSRIRRVLRGVVQECDSSARPPSLICCSPILPPSTERGVRHRSFARSSNRVESSEVGYDDSWKSGGSEPG
jgi:hypothetical protein